MTPSTELMLWLGYAIGAVTAYLVATRRYDGDQCLPRHTLVIASACWPLLVVGLALVCIVAVIVRESERRPGS